MRKKISILNYPAKLAARNIAGWNIHHFHPGNATAIWIHFPARKMLYYRRVIIVSFVYFFLGSISSFQSFFRLEETSWSLGMALGPLLTGWVSNFNETGSCNDACALGILNSIRPSGRSRGSETSQNLLNMQAFLPCKRWFRNLTAVDVGNIWKCPIIYSL